MALPVLRKDFIIDEAQILESLAIGADALLLIVAALKPEQLSALHHFATTHKMSVLVEVHTRDEIGMAVDAGAKIIGINNRNLTTLEVDLATTEKLLPEIPRGITIVSESGIRTRADLKRMAACPSRRDTSGGRANARRPLTGGAVGASLSERCSRAALSGRQIVIDSATERRWPQLQR